MTAHYCPRCGDVFVDNAEHADVVECPDCLDELAERLARPGARRVLSDPDDPWSPAVWRAMP